MSRAQKFVVRLGLVAGLVTASFVLLTTQLNFSWSDRSLEISAVAKSEVASGTVALSRLSTARNSSSPSLQRASFAEIVGSRSNGLVVRALAENPRVLVFDYGSLHLQGEALNRVAALVEKRGAPRDHIMSHEELAAFIAARNENFDTFYFGHNYTASKLAIFFNLARTQRVSLSPAELAVRDMAMKYAMIAEVSGRWVPLDPEKSLVSIVQPTSGRPGNGVVVDQSLRNAILLHELSHGDFATIPAYRDYCIRFWRATMSHAEREAFMKFIERRGYDIQNERLVIDEAQAFLAHTPDSRAFSAQLLHLPSEQVAGLQQAFWRGLEAAGLHNSVARNSF